jgi:hypothetical protein
VPGARQASEDAGAPRTTVAADHARLADVGALLGFGLEQVAAPADRAKLVKQALSGLGVC